MSSGTSEGSSREALEMSASVATLSGRIRTLPSAATAAAPGCSTAAGTVTSCTRRLPARSSCAARNCPSFRAAGVPIMSAACSLAACMDWDLPDCKRRSFCGSGLLIGNAHRLERDRLHYECIIGDGVDPAVELHSEHRHCGRLGRESLIFKCRDQVERRLHKA